MFNLDNVLPLLFDLFKKGINLFAGCLESPYPELTETGGLSLILKTRSTCRGVDVSFYNVKRNQH
jgi:hypothetical protein